MCFSTIVEAGDEVLRTDLGGNHEGCSALKVGQPATGPVPEEGQKKVSCRKAR